MKTFIEYVEENVNESVTFSVADYSPENPVRDLTDLSYVIIAN